MKKLGESLKGVDLQLQESQGKQTGSTADDICEVHGLEKIFISACCDERCPECWRIESQEKAKKQRVVEAHYQLGLPKRLNALTFDNYRPVNGEAAKHLASCREFSEKVSGGLILIGSVGTGKTHLAVAICKAVCDEGLSAKLVTIPEVIREVRSTWGKGDRYGQVDTEEAVIERYSSVHLLVIDEIGSQYGTDGEKIIISEIINNRYNNELPTVLIGNVTMPQATEYLGERVIDRVRHGGKVLVFDWDSYRRQK